MFFLCACVPILQLSAPAFLHILHSVLCELLCIVSHSITTANQGQETASSCACACFSIKMVKIFSKRTFVGSQPCPYWTAGLGEKGCKIQETLRGKLKLGPCGKDSNVQYMAHLLNQVSYSRTINSEYNSEFEDTDGTDHHFAPKQSHQQPTTGANGCQKW